MNPQEFKALLDSLNRIAKAIEGKADNAPVLVVSRFIEERGRPIEENNNPYGGKYWIKEPWGQRFSTKEEDDLIEKLQVIPIK